MTTSIFGWVLGNLSMTVRGGPTSVAECDIVRYGVLGGEEFGAVVGFIDLVGAVQKSAHCGCEGTTDEMNWRMYFYIGVSNHLQSL